jgi:uncharacterized protein
MKLAGDYLFEASVPEVWSALFDPVILAAVMPGCEKLELIDGHFVGEIVVKVGPVQGKFAGKVELKDKDEPHGYTMIVDGRGAAGFVKATATIRLAAEGAHTRVTYDTDAQVGGKLASVGQRLIEASARAIVAQSLEGLHANIKLRAAAYRAAEASAQVEPPALPDAPAASAPSEAAAPAPVAAPPPVVAFTPVKVTQAAMANAVAKEVASSLFPPKVLVAIIAIQAVIIAWLLIRG